MVVAAAAAGPREVVLESEMSWKPRVHDVRSPPELLTAAAAACTAGALT